MQDNFRKWQMRGNANASAFSAISWKQNAIVLDLLSSGVPDVEYATMRTFSQAGVD
jgi:hypothetical protein